MRLPLLFPALRWSLALILPVTLSSMPLRAADPLPSSFGALPLEQSNAFAKLALAGISREFPNKPGVVLNSPDEVLRPLTLHPAFYGSFDWHSSVHGHWLLVRLLRLHPELPAAKDVRARLELHLSAANLKAEALVFDRKGNKSFERMYGWAWALRLAMELRAFEDPDAKRWAANYAPLEQRLVTGVKDYLPKLTYPVRTGVHPDTAFALGQILDYARAVEDKDLTKLVEERAMAFYGQDRDYPIAYEPSGEDFFSSGLNTADLMRRVLPPADFSAWLDRFFPSLKIGDLGNWGKPAVVSDISDPKIGHLVGLNLSRAWTLQGIASALTPEDPRQARLLASAKAHADAGLKYVFSGHYEGEHWLGTFAVYLLTESGLNPNKPHGHETVPR
jgi:hypothetical protein